MMQSMEFILAVFAVVQMLIGVNLVSLQEANAVLIRPIGASMFGEGSVMLMSACVNGRFEWVI